MVYKCANENNCNVLKKKIRAKHHENRKMTILPMVTNHQIYNESKNVIFYDLL